MRATNKLFIGTEAEGPDKGEKTLFIPKTAEIKSFVSIDKLLNKKSICRLYFGAGDNRGITTEQKNLISFLHTLNHTYKFVIELEGNTTPPDAIDTIEQYINKKIPMELVFTFTNTNIPTEKKKYYHSAFIHNHLIISIKTISDTHVYWDRLSMNSLDDLLYNNDEEATTE